MNFLRIMMPYCVMPLDGGFHIVLNRNYKPLGMTSREWVVYENHPSKVKIKGLTVDKAEHIGLHVLDKRDCLYLYDDTTVPDTPVLLTRYNKILAKLMKMEVEA